MALDTTESGGLPAAAPRRRVRFARWRPPVALAAVLLGLVAGQVVAFIVLAAGGNPSGVAVGIGFLAADLVILAVVLAFAHRGAERLTAGTLGIRRAPFWPALGWSAAIFAAVGGAEGLWVTFVAGPEGGGGGSGGIGEVAAPGGVLSVVLIIAGLAITAPIVEELAFRGYLFPALTRWRGPWIAAIVTALLFGAAHVLVYPPAFLPALAFFGFGACLLFWFTGSLLPAVGLHALNNGIAAGVMFGWSWQIPLLGFGAAVVAIVLLMPLARERAPQMA